MLHIKNIYKQNVWLYYPLFHLQSTKFANNRTQQIFILTRSKKFKYFITESLITVLLK
jgi:hypothetical protein